MVRECLDHEVLIVYENIDETYRQHVQVNLDGSGAAKRHQVHL